MFRFFVKSILVNLRVSKTVSLANFAAGAALILNFGILQPNKITQIYLNLPFTCCKDDNFVHKIDQLPSSPHMNGSFSENVA